MKEKNLKTIVIIGISLAVIALVTLFIIYFSTDILKSSEKVFNKYFDKALINIDRITDLSAEDQYISDLRNKSYNDSTNLTLKYTNSQGNVEQFNSVISGSTNGQTKNSYRNINVRYDNNLDIINAELLTESNIYGVLFFDVIPQFASADRNEITTLLDRLNISREGFIKYENIRGILGTIEDGRSKVKQVWTKFKMQNISGNQYTVSKNRVITLSNGESKNTKAYMLRLSSEQTRKLYSNIAKELNYSILNNIQIQEFPELTFTTYVFESQVPRIVIDGDKKSLTIDFYENNLNIQFANKLEEAIEVTTIEMKKQDGKTGVDIKIQDKDNKEKNVKLEFKTEINEARKILSANAYLQTDSIKELQIGLEQNIELTEDVNIEKKLSEQKNINLSNLPDYQLISAVNSLLKRIDTKLETVNKTANSELINLWIKSNNEIENKCKQLSEIGKNEFNNQFLNYRGQDISNELIYNMIDVASRNMSGYTIYSGDNIKVYLEQGKQNISKANELKSKIEEVKSNYNIDFQYNSDGKISVILMEKVNKKR